MPGPILAIPFPTYQPSMRIITNITNASPAVVTTSFAHQYLTGTIVRLDIPKGFGMVQANQLFGDITVLSPTTFSIPINTIYFDQFMISNVFPYSYQSAQSVPIGENNNMLTAAVQNVLPYSAT